MKLQKQNAESPDFGKLKKMITTLQGLLDNSTSSKLTLKALLAFQDEDGSFKLFDTYEVPSDARVEFCHTPTYIGAAILMRELLSGRDDLAEQLKKALNASLHRQLEGSGYESEEGRIEAMNIFIRGDLCSFLKTQPTLCPEFNTMIHNILAEYDAAIKNGHTKGSWGVDYREPWQNILNKLQ